MIDPKETGRRVEEEEDFIALKRFNFSLAKLLERYPDGCPSNIIAAALLLSEEGVEVVYDNAVKQLRELMGVEL